MIHYITKAIHEYSKHQLSLSSEVSKCPQNFADESATILTYIYIMNDKNKKFKVSISYQKKLLQEIVSIFLMEDDADDATLQEMALETTNMLVGSAKIIAVEDENPFNIETPFLDTEFDYTSADAVKIDAYFLCITIENA